MMKMLARSPKGARARASLLATAAFNMFAIVVISILVMDNPNRSG